MGTNSNISWTRHSYNPWHGCQKVSSGCKYCYMMRDKEKYGQDPTVITRSKTTFNDPLKWTDPALVFTCSWSDFLIKEADAWRGEAIDIIRRTPHLMYQILTKRIERVHYLPAGMPENFIIGISAENQSNFDHRYPELADVKHVRGWKIFLSLEPLIGEIKISAMIHLLRVKPDWVIIGGESGNDNGKWRYRACEMSWITNLINECVALDIPVFIKQTGTYIAKRAEMKHRAGADPSEWPDMLRVQQFPKFFEPFLLTGSENSVSLKPA